MDRKFTRAELILSIVLALALSLVSARAFAVESSLRIGLARFSGAKQLTVRYGPTAATMCVSGDSITLTRNGAATQAGRSVTFAPDDSESLVTIETPAQSGRYRGTIEVNLRQGSLQVINVVALEDYLRGVLPPEMSQHNPEEALRAQAVAARTYVLRNRRKHASSGFDVCDSDHCQCYGGAASEQPGCSRAVESTSGQVLTYGGELAHVQYSADCGGVTENYAELYSRKDCAYLCGVVEPQEIAHRSWEKTYTLQTLSGILLRAGVKEAQGLTGVTVTRTTPSGRALDVEVSGTCGATTIGGEKLKKLLGLQSRLYTAECADGKITFRGKGWGHGIGMCQVGAKALAQPPLCYTYDRILAHYFPGTTICNLSGAAAPPAISTPAVDVVALQPDTPPTAPVRSPAPPRKTTPRPVDLDLRLEEPRL